MNNLHNDAVSDDDDDQDDDQHHQNHPQVVLSSLEYKDEWIWISPMHSLLPSDVSSSEPHEFVVPLLPSTVQLLQEHLKEVIPIPFITSLDQHHQYQHHHHDDDGTNTEATDGVQQITNKVTSVLQVTNSTEDNNVNLNSTDVPESSSSSPLTNNNGSSDVLLRLTRVTGLADQIIHTINDFRTMRRNNATLLGRYKELEQKQNPGYRRPPRHRRRRGNNNNNNGGEGGGKEVIKVKEEDTGNDVPKTDPGDPEKNNVTAEEPDKDKDMNGASAFTTATNMMATTPTSAAWYMLIATLNSLRILTPILFHIIWHSQRNDKELLLSLTTLLSSTSSSSANNTQPGDVYNNDDDDDNDEEDEDEDIHDDYLDNNGGNRRDRRNRERRAKCLLIATKVYDQCTVRQCQMIWKNMEHLYYLLGVVPSTTSLSSSSSSTATTMSPSEQEQTLLSYMNIISTNMKLLVTGFMAATTTCTVASIETTPPPGNDSIVNDNDDIKATPVLPKPTWLNYHPFDAMDEYDQIKLYMSTQILDQRFQLQVNADDMNPKDKMEKNAYLNAIYDLHEQLKGILANRYPGSRISMYGSCLSDLSLGKNADVDFSLYIEELADTKNDYEMKKITEDTYRSVTKNYVYTTCRLLERNRKQRFQNMTPVAYARVPVVKGTYIKAGNPHSSDGSLDFDICFINDIAVSNSELIRQYSLVSDTVKSLMLLVKRWAKANHLASTQDNSISSYAWMNLVIFYLQCLGMVPNLQCPKLMKLANHTTNKDGAYWDNVNFLNTRFVTWEQASTVWTVPTHRLQNMSITALLYGFFDFYTKTFPSALYMVSIAAGASEHAKPKTLFDKSSLFWCIEDPFEVADSYCPHDLGMHASEPGSALILERMRAAEVYLRTQLLQVLDMEMDETTSLLSNIQSLWPPVKLSTSVKDEVKTNNRGNAPRKDPIRTTGNREDMNIEAKPDIWPTLAGPATTKKPAATNNVKIGPAIAPIRSKANNVSKPNNGVTMAKPNNHRRNNNNNNANAKAGSRSTIPSTAANPRPPARSSNSNNGNSNNNSNHNNQNNNNKPPMNDPNRRRRPPPKKVATTSATGAATTTTTTSAPLPKQQQQGPQKAIVK
jgi:senataxin/terminal uridylyltransferase